MGELEHLHSGVRAGAGQLPSRPDYVEAQPLYLLLVSPST